MPAVAREKLEVNEVVVSIMMNYALLYLSNYVLRNFMLDTSITYSASFALPEASRLAGIWHGTRLHTGIFVAIGAVIVSWLFCTTRPQALASAFAE